MTILPQNPLISLNPTHSPISRLLKIVSIRRIISTKNLNLTMRHQWRLLLQFQLRSKLYVSSRSSHFQVHFDPNFQAFRYFSSLLHKHTIQNTVQTPSFDGQFRNLVNPKNLITSGFSSETALEQKESDYTFVSDIFTKSDDLNEIRKDLELNGIVVSHELVLNVLNKLDSSPDVAINFFKWVLKSDSERLSSKSYNLMLGILGDNGLVKEFWDLVDVMKKKGYGISKGVRDKVLDKFEKEELVTEVEKLKSAFASGSAYNSEEKICLRVCRIARSKVWGDDLERELRDLNATFSSHMVKTMLENLSTEPRKALIFFRWIEESEMFKHDQQTYNAMARVLGREDCIDRFWKVVDEIRSSNYEMELETFVKVLGRFVKRKMINDAVNLYEFAMSGGIRPSLQCSTFLLKKIAAGKHFDINLFSKVVRIFTENGSVLTNSMLDSVLKSLKGAGRFGECNQVLKAMEECGFVLTGNLRSKIAFQLTSNGQKEEANEFINIIEASGCEPDYKTWTSRIEGYCVAGDLKMASDCLHTMIEKGGVSTAGYALDLIVNAYCLKNKTTDASNLLCNLVDEKDLTPKHTTYKALISKLLVQGRFEEALKLLGLMRNHGFPPYIDPFIEYVSKSGTAEDAIVFLKGMTSKRFPSTSLFLRVFETFFNAGRLNDAQDFLSKCPGYIRNHTDVLILFSSVKSKEAAASTTTVAS